MILNPDSNDSTQNLINPLMVMSCGHQNGGFYHLSHSDSKSRECHSSSSKTRTSGLTQGNSGPIGFRTGAIEINQAHQITCYSPQTGKQIYRSHTDKSKNSILIQDQPKMKT
jgi:hypothetical protein